THSPTPPHFPTPPGRAVSEPSARKIKDSAADLYNLTSRWQRISGEGFTIASRIAKKCISTSVEEETKEEQNFIIFMILAEGTAHYMLETFAVARLKRHQFSPLRLFVFPDLVARNVLGTYEKEMALRRLIASDLAHVSSRAAAMVLLSCWLYEPHISPHTAFDLQSMLLETGYQLPTQQ
uniref:Uncharacterized protein n=1 Tax=Eptatretus burgeri TaxID=7764 RepID=A0A8C4R4C1_EPTBU